MWQELVRQLVAVAALIALVWGVPSLIDRWRNVTAKGARERPAQVAAFRVTEPDPFAQPATFSSGVRWAPDDYRSLSAEARATYRKFAAKPTSRTVSNGAVTR